MRGKGMQGGEELNINVPIRFNDRFGFNNCTGIKKFVCLNFIEPTIDDVYEP